MTHLLGAALLALGCAGDEEAEGAATAVRDSAGVRIVEHPPGARDTLHAEEPLLTIGQNGDERHQFYRVQDVIALSDGRIVVADRGSHQVRYYAPDGTHLTSLGRRGRGPGEFEALGELQRMPGDTVVGDGVRARRLTFFSPEPALDGVIDYLERLELLPDAFSTCGMGEPRFGGLMESRTLVLWGPTCIQGQGDVGLRAFRHGIHVWEPDAEEATVLDPVEREWRLERPGEPLPDRFAAVPLSAGVDVAVTRRRIYLTSPERYTLTALSRTGRPVMIVRDLAPRRRVNDDLRSEFEQELSPGRLKELATSHYPDSLPAFDRVVAGEGEIWARHFPGPVDTLKYWSVYGNDGAARGIVTLPTNFELTAVRRGRAYGLTTDAMDVERIQVFETPVR